MTDYKRKKIAFVAPIYLPAPLSGSDYVTNVLAEELAKKNHDVSIITSKALTPRYWYDPIFGKKIEKKIDSINNVTVYRLDCNQIFSSFYFIIVKYFYFILPKDLLNRLKIIANGPHLMGLFDLLHAENFDVVHCYPFPLNINKQVVDSIKNLEKKPKLILTPFFHSHVAGFNNSALKDIFDHADVIHVISKAEKNDIEKLFKIKQEKLIIIPLFLNLFGLHEVEDLKNDISLFKKRYRLQNRKIILFAGNKGKMKGATDLLIAVDKLYKKNSMYILIAIGSSTNEWESTKKKIHKDCLLDLPYKEGKEKEIIFAASDIYCMPSKSETFGLVYLEAWHKKKPLIAAGIPAVKELLEDASLFVQYGNITSIMECIEKISYNSLLAKKLGEKGFNRLMTFYDFSKIFPRYIKLFDL